MVDLAEPDIVAVAALLRTLNAMENIRSSNSFLSSALGQPPGTVRQLLHLASADTKDAITVLTGGPRRLYAISTTLIRTALRLERIAANLSPATARDHLLRHAIELQELARRLMLNP